MCIPYKFCVFCCFDFSTRGIGMRFFVFYYIKKQNTDNVLYHSCAAHRDRNWVLYVLLYPRKIWHYFVGRPKYNSSGIVIADQRQVGCTCDLTNHSKTQSTYQPLNQSIYCINQYALRARWRLKVGYCLLGLHAFRISGRLSARVRANRQSDR